MRLLLFIFVLFSFSSYSQTTVQKFKVCEVKRESAGVTAMVLNDVTLENCLSSTKSAITTKEIQLGLYTDGVPSYVTYEGEDWVQYAPYSFRIPMRMYYYNSKGVKTYFSSSNNFKSLYLSGPYDAPVEPKPCETPKTDDQCNKGKTATITGNDVFWATGNYKGCTFTAKDGVFVKAADGTMTGDATSTGSTGKAWCETTDSSYNPADDEALSKNPAFSPAKDNDPKNCKNGWVQAGGGKFHCLNDTSGNVDAPPDKVNPDGSINSDKDGKPQPPDAGVGKPPTGGTDPDGGGTGPDGGGDGECEGEDCEGGGGGTKPPARPADPWADILDAADVARVKADTQSVQDELADFYRSAASGFQININKPAAGAMPSYGDITQGGQKISLSMSWLDKISFADGRAGVLVLCSLIAAYIILVRR